MEKLANPHGLICLATRGKSVGGDRDRTRTSPQRGDRFDDRGGVPTEGGTLKAERPRVRRETIALLRDVAKGESADDVDAAAVDRANRLLAAYIREVLGAEPNAMSWAFPDMSP